MSKTSNTPKKNGHFGKGLLAGALFGIAAGIYMSSKEGKQMAQKLQKESKMIEGKLRDELKKKSSVSQEAYAEATDTVLAYYLKSKKIAKSEIPALKAYLHSKWKLVQSEMKDVSAEQKGKKTVSKKKAPAKKKTAAKKPAKKKA